MRVPCGVQGCCQAGQEDSEHERRHLGKCKLRGSHSGLGLLCGDYIGIT